MIKPNMNKFINLKSFLVLFLILNQSCKSTRTVEFKENLNQTRCEDALLVLPENESTYKLTNKLEKASGTVLSYSFTGAAYTAQVLWDVTVGVTAITILCAPTIALSMSAPNAKGHLTPYCLPGDIKPILSPPLGKNAYKNTENWRCEEMAPLSQSIRKVAKCFYDRGDKENITKAVNTLESVANSSFYSCLPTSELNEFTKDLNIYRNEVKSFP